MRSYLNSEVPPPIMEGAPPPAEWRLPPLDWDRPPWNRWSFQRVREFLPTATVRRGERVSTLVEAPEPIEGIAFEGVSRRMTVAEWLDRNYADGFLVMLDGKIIHESYWNGMDRRTPHLVQSVSKSVTATACAALIEEGLLDPAAPITEPLPELANTAWAGATLGQVMDMTSGVRFDETDYANRASDIGRMDVASGWKPIPEGMEDHDWPACVWELILSMKNRDSEHGARFQYRSIETDVMAHAMERATGKRLPQIVSERLWEPLGAEEDACYTVDRAGYALADGGFNATLRDLARLGLAYLEDGMAEDRQVIPRAFVEDVRSGGHGRFDDHGREYFPNGRYRNQFWIEDEARQGHLCLGVFGQMIYVSPERGMVFVKLSTWPDFTDADLLKDCMAAFHAIARAFGRDL